MQPTSLRFTADARAGITLHALEWAGGGGSGAGDGPLVVLLHGGGANARWWDHIAPTLAEGRRVVALDFRGHGDSDHPEELLVGAFNLDLEALLAHLGLREVVLVGHSMGAHVALDHASRHLATRGLVLIDPARGGERRSRRVARLALALRRSYATRQEAVERYRFIPAAQHVEESLRLRIAAHSVRCQDDGRWAFKFDPRWFGVRSKPRPDPSQVRCPALIVRGAESTLLSAEAARDWAAELPDGRLLEIEGAGHHVPLEQPAALAEGIARFLDELEGSVPAAIGDAQPEP